MGLMTAVAQTGSLDVRLHRKETRPHRTEQTSDTQVTLLSIRTNGTILALLLQHLTAPSVNDGCPRAVYAWRGPLPICIIDSTQSCSPNFSVSHCMCASIVERSLTLAGLLMVCSPPNGFGGYLWPKVPTHADSEVLVSLFGSQVSTETNR
jgi:hypothetical protein